MSDEAAPQIGVVGMAVILVLVSLMRPVQWWWRLSDAMRRI